MGTPTDLKNAAKTWQSMVDNNRALLMHKSGHDVDWWTSRFGWTPWPRGG
ncbi:hypothetical protein [Arthrobacter sp. ISL-72]|nr:hypothetical protein [Arthrobacter sp. ISL-72]MBT2593914.1 hypothetical protein [Arthrobacter sp. ISL-72]